MNQTLIQLSVEYFGEQPVIVNALSGSASNRQYFRLADSQGATVIGVVGENRKENHAFLALDRTMFQAGIRVPKVLASSDDEMCYLQEDLGAISLFDQIAQCQKSGVWDEATQTMLHQVMRELPKIQFEGARGFSFEECSREQHFTESIIRWDLNYFKYCFLKPSGLVFDEMELEREYDLLVSILLAPENEVASGRFMYRDFQSRNVMIHAGNPYYIDFQGGYEGPVYYDVASFLWQARANYPSEMRRELLKSYHSALQKYIQIDWETFTNRLEKFVFFRLIQVLGAYGFRGLFERKAAFISPIYQALEIINQVIAERNLAEQFPYISHIFAQLKEMDRFKPQPSKGSLTVRITSFSFKKGIPEDNSGNGGGFVFDCRAPHNPGRYAEYKKITGLQQPVIDFLEDNQEEMRKYLGVERYEQIVADKLGTELTMPQFMEHVYGVVDPAVATYITRGFTSLCVNFGCTGGQHRSVYGAQHLAEHLKSLHPDLKIVLTHREQGLQSVL